ncbi:MAG: hypothetical protein RIR83_1697, partial [Pseudomonadota bacterium]
MAAFGNEFTTTDQLDEPALRTLVSLGSAGCAAPDLLFRAQQYFQILRNRLHL